MKSNLFFTGLGVLFAILFCINSANGRNIRNFETKYKREVDPLPEHKADTNDGQSQEKEEQIKAADNIPAAQPTTEEIEAKRAAEVEQSPKSNDNLATAPDSFSNLETKSPTPEAQITKEPVVETAQAIVKEEMAVKAAGDDEKEAPELKPAASNIAPVAVNPTPRFSAPHKSYRPFWSRSVI